jgi:hypothetical protein
VENDIGPVLENSAAGKGRKGVGSEYNGLSRSLVSEIHKIGAYSCQKIAFITDTPFFVNCNYHFHIGVFLS